MNGQRSSGQRYMRLDHTRHHSSAHHKFIVRRPDADRVFAALTTIWGNRVPKSQVQGIHGILFYDLPEKRQYYPTLRDEEARNPDGSRLRAGGFTTLS
jgi:hypothetical protein